MSLTIMADLEAKTAKELETPQLDLPVVERLVSYQRQCSPFRLAEWARSHTLPLYFVDNCWARVIVSGPELCVFYREILGDAALAELGSRTSEQRKYLIEAEEF